MLRTVILSTAALACAASPVLAADRRPIGQETTITFASNGGLRNWQAGPRDSNIVYVQDRQLRWYEVALSGSCARDRTSLTFVYTTDNVGTFDRFSRVSVPQSTPGAVCAVTSIKTSLPPPGQPGAPAHADRRR